MLLPTDLLDCVALHNDGPAAGAARESLSGAGIPSARLPPGGTCPALGRDAFTGAAESDDDDAADDGDNDDDDDDDEALV